MQNNLPQKAQNQLTATISKERFLRVFAPENCLLHGHKITGIQEALQPQTPSISVVGRIYGREFQKSYVMAWLVCLNEVLGLKNPMSEMQIELCAGEITSTYAYLTIAELSLLFRRIITGEFGDFYERLSMAKVCDFFKKFDQERTAFLIEQNQQQHQSFRYQEDKNENNIIQRKMKRFLR